MAKVHGKGGKATIDANEIAEIGSWTGDLSINLAETTALQDNFTEQVAGPVGMTGTIECFWDSADTNGQVAMINAVITPLTVKLMLYEDSTHSFYFSAFLEAGSNVSITDAVKRTYGFTSHGTIAYT